MRFEKTDVWGFEHAIRGMRNPMNSWSKSDTVFSEDYRDFIIGENDLDLMQRLIKGGSEHRKFLRQIFVSVDITAPLYWWKEADTYKIGTTANSTSTMHKLATTPITIDCFETDDYKPDIIFDEGIDTSGDNPYYYQVSVEDVVGTNEDNYYRDETIIGFLEALRLKHLDYVEKAKATTSKEDVVYFQDKAKLYWKELIRWLPESWLQTRTVTMNYENLLNICKQRKGHKLTEWSQFIDWAHTLPYAKELLFYNQKVVNE